MRVLGFAALSIAVLSLFSWLVSWVCFTFFVTGPSGVIVSVARTFSFIGNFGQFLAIGLLSVGLIMLGKRLAGPAA